MNPPWSAGNGSGPGGPAEPIVLERVSKWYRRRDRRAMLAMSLYRRLTGALTPGFWALSDVSLAVRAGEALGIVGPNGAGKTTLLKVIAGITHPTSGRVAVRAHVSTHLGVGSGFQQYLTGRDNVFLQGSILGLTNRQIASRFDAIVALAGIETAVDQPLWTYSAGMTTRLGFAVAAHVDFDVLVLDEALSVGDRAFNERCAAVLQGFRAAQRTLILVSHSLATVRALCDRVLWLDRGGVRALGAADEILRAYEAARPRGDPAARVPGS